MFPNLINQFPCCMISGILFSDIWGLYYFMVCVPFISSRWRLQQISSLSEQLPFCNIVLYASTHRATKRASSFRGKIGLRSTYKLILLGTEPKFQWSDVQRHLQYTSYVLWFMEGSAIDNAGYDDRHCLMFLFVLLSRRCFCDTPIALCCIALSSSLLQRFASWVSLCQYC